MSAWIPAHRPAAAATCGRKSTSLARSLASACRFAQCAAILLGLQGSHGVCRNSWHIPVSIASNLDVAGTDGAPWPCAVLLNALDGADMEVRCRLLVDAGSAPAPTASSEFELIWGPARMALEWRMLAASQSRATRMGRLHLGAGTPMCCRWFLIGLLAAGGVCGRSATPFGEPAGSE